MWGECQGTIWFYVRGIDVHYYCLGILLSNIVTLLFHHGVLKVKKMSGLMTTPVCIHMSRLVWYPVYSSLPWVRGQKKKKKRAAIRHHNTSSTAEELNLNRALPTHACWFFVTEELNLNPIWVLLLQYKQTIGLGTSLVAEYIVWSNSYLWKSVLCTGYWVSLSILYG